MSEEIVTDEKRWANVVPILLLQFMLLSIRAVLEAQSMEELQRLKQAWTGRKDGLLKEFFSLVPHMTIEDRREYVPILNDLKRVFAEVGK